VETNPAAWASKYARLYAISNATEPIHMTAKSLVESFDDDKWNDAVAEINKNFKFPADKQWDGILWPYGESQRNIPRSLL
jgi:hypothetical protein